MKFAHLADTHLGYRQYNLDEREEDFYAAFHEAIDKIIAAKCDFVVHAGDLFDEPRPHVRAMVEVRKALDRLHENNIPIFAIPGNHDILMRRGAMIPHAIYRRIEVLTVKKPWREFNGIFIAGLPYHSKIHANALKEELHELATEAKKYEKKILMLHQGIDKYFPLEYELKFADIPRGFDYYALGHVHKRIIDDLGFREEAGEKCHLPCGRGSRLVYPGSTEMWRIDELSDYEKNGKGFFIVDVENFEIERVNLDVRPFVKAEVDSNLDLEKIKEALKVTKKPVINIAVASDVHEYQRIHQRLVNELKDALYLDIKRKRREEKEEALYDKTINIQELMNEVMKDYSEAERDYAYSVFKALSKGDLDEARIVTEYFYKVFK
ncbi:MAG: DNA repair exonuclease [Methanobacteriota archaeon]